MTSVAEIKPPQEKGSMTYLTVVCLVATLGGLLFGYDTAVIAGAIGFLEKRFELGPAMVGWAASCALAGCVAGVAFAGALSDRFGRRNTLIFAAVLFLISAIGTALPQHLFTFIVFRFIGGMGVGAASMTTPMYIAEISPARHRGRMVSLNQLAIVTGFLVVYFVNYFIAAHGSALNRAEADALLQGSRRIEVRGELADVAGAQLARQLEKYWDMSDESVLEDLAAKMEAKCKAAIGDAWLARAAGQIPAEAPIKTPADAAHALSRRLSLYGAQIQEADIAAMADHIANALSGAGVSVKDTAALLMERRLTEALKEKQIQTSAGAPTPAEIAAVFSPALKDRGALMWNVQRGWRWMFGSEALPALLLFALLFFVPESPRWLTKQGQAERARAILARVDGAAHAEREMAEINDALTHESPALGQLLKPGMRIVLTIGIVLAVLQQVTGINVFLYYAPVILKGLAGANVDVALLQTILVGAVNAAFTIIAIWTVDRLGRKPLMLVGAAGMGVSLFAIAVAAALNQLAAWVLIFILGYIACFAMSVGPVTWVILSEIFPTKIRGRALGIATLCLWVANFIVSQTFPMMDKNPWLASTFNHGFPFIIYGVFCIVLVLFILRFVPETKGKSLEEIERMWGAGKE